ncbi:IS1 family transposase [Klebsiella quasipneumoniae]|uniref:IS1 family transposase n=1 Tax=Klebsiella quasipneumoniae TaxID=1463165 RepID=UPI001F5B67B6|nr:IS1 family transposase [Klebsiella quasipneumoniae]
MASVSVCCPSCSATEGVMRNGKSTAGHQRYLCSHCRKTWQLTFTYRSQPGTHQKILIWHEGVGAASTYGRGLNTILRHFKKLRPQSVTSRIQPGSDVIVCAEMDEQWGYVGAKSRQRWLFYAYDRIRRVVVAHVFGERTMATLERLLSLLSVFDVVVWMTDGWPMYESRLKGKLHVISKRYTQRIERHNLNLRQHLARLGRKSLSFSKSVELHDKVIGHYLNIKHYQ